MIQRIQSIFLVLMIACMGAFLYLPIWGKMDIATGEVHQLKAIAHEQYTEADEIGTKEYMPFALAGALAGVIILISIIELFQYKNRLLQMKLGMLNSVLIVIILGLLMWFIFSGQDQWLPTIPGQFGVGLFMPALAMIFNRMAIRAIKKDEDLVRSVDRIR
jgi:hypothetical protein